jgi:hypothetical protein
VQIDDVEAVCAALESTLMTRHQGARDHEIAGWIAADGEAVGQRHHARTVGPKHLERERLVRSVHRDHGEA